MIRFIRFTNANPSIFEFPDDDKFLETAERHIYLRERDAGKLSLWGEDDISIAQFIARKDKLPSKVHYILLPSMAFGSSYSPVPDPDRATFECAQHLHYTVQVGAAIVPFLEALRAGLNEYAAAAAFKRESEIPDFLRAVYRRCLEAPQLDPAGEWARVLVQTSTTPP